MAAATGPPGRFITLEGVEGAGKSTQVERLAAWLTARGAQVVATCEPDGTALGSAVRRLLREGPGVDPLAEAFLFAASRAEHVRRVIRPALAAGAIVVCDRFGDSTVAYQGYGRGVPVDRITALNHLATDGLAPDLTLVLDLDAARGLGRARGRRPATAPGQPDDPFERLSVEFHERVRKGYWAIRDQEPGRVVLLDADRPVDVISQEVVRLVTDRLARGGRA